MQILRSVPACASQHLLVVYLAAGAVPVAHSLWLGRLSASGFRHSQSEAAAAKSVQTLRRELIAEYSDTQWRRARLSAAAFVSCSGYS
jgi:hypothetical protein